MWTVTACNDEWKVTCAIASRNGVICVNSAHAYAHVYGGCTITIKAESLASPGEDDEYRAYRVIRTEEK